MIEFFAYLTKALGDNVPVIMAFGFIGAAVVLALVAVLCPLKDQPVDEEDGER